MSMDIYFFKNRDEGQGPEVYSASVFGKNSKLQYWPSKKGNVEKVSGKGLKYMQWSELPEEEWPSVENCSAPELDSEKLKALQELGLDKQDWELINFIKGLGAELKISKNGHKFIRFAKFYPSKTN